MHTLELYLIYQGYIAPASPGVLEAVAERRAVYWQQIPANWHEYGVLVAVADCEMLGKSGWLAIGSEIKSALVVDCAQKRHAPLMIEERLIDANLRERGEGWLVLR